MSTSMRRSKVHRRYSASRLFCPTLCFVVALSGVSMAGTLVSNETIQHDGLTRYFDYYIPDLPQLPAAPLVFLLHGGTRNKDDFATGPFQEFFSLADQYGFFVLLPNGTDPATSISGSTGSFNWNDCRNDAGEAGTVADDVGLISDLIDWMLGTFSIDDQRIYSAGASNGGMMSYRLAIELSDRIAATASVIANLPANSECASQPTYPLTILVMNGSSDAIMPFGGGEISGGGGFTLSADATRDFFLDFLDIQSSAQTFQFPDIDLADGGVVDREIYSGGIDGTSVVFLRANGAGHTNPSKAHPVTPLVEFFLGKQNHDIEAATEIWSALSPVTLPEPTTATSLMVGTLGLGWADRRRWKSARLLDS